MESPWENDEFARISLAKIDVKFLPGTKLEVDFLERELGLKPGDRVLDLGCGAGRHAIELAIRGYEVVGVDVSFTMLEEARKRAAEAGVQLVLLELNLRDLRSQLQDNESFDAAICLCESGLGVLGERSDISFLKDVHDLLRADARFVLTGLNALRQYHRSALSAALDYILGVIHWEAPIGADTLREDIRIYTPSELTLMLGWAGFRDVRVYGCAPGNFIGQALEVDDVEMMLAAVKR